VAPYPLRVYRVPFSTNVERVALAAGHKGIELEYVDVPYDDRTEIVRVSGQELVPVLVDGDAVITDSPGHPRAPRGAFPRAAALPARVGAPRGAAGLPRLVQRAVEAAAEPDRRRGVEA
jgi:Glutathione S-transferase, N-terminal domain